MIDTIEFSTGLIEDYLFLGFVCIFYLLIKVYLDVVSILCLYGINKVANK